jgi:hypothetical protein
MPPQFRLRPGSASDLTHAVRLYDICLGSDKLVALLFPRRTQDPAAYKTYLYRLYAKRYWAVEWMFTYLVRIGEGGEEEEVVGFACWKKPKGEISFGERWFSLCEYFSSISFLLIVFLSLLFFSLFPFLFPIF